MYTCYNSTHREIATITDHPIIKATKMKLTKEVLKAFSQFSNLNDDLHIKSNYRNSIFTQSVDGSVYHEITFPKRIVQEVYEPNLEKRMGVEFETFKIDSLNQLLDLHNLEVEHYGIDFPLEMYVDEDNDVAISIEKVDMLFGFTQPKVSDMNVPNKKFLVDDEKCTQSVLVYDTERFKKALELSEADKVRITHNPIISHVVANDSVNLFTCGFSACSYVPYTNNLGSGIIALKHADYIASLIDENTNLLTISEFNHEGCKVVEVLLTETNEVKHRIYLK